MDRKWGSIEWCTSRIHHNEGPTISTWSSDDNQYCIVDPSNRPIQSFVSKEKYSRGYLLLLYSSMYIGEHIIDIGGLENITIDITIKSAIVVTLNIIKNWADIRNTKGILTSQMSSQNRSILNGLNAINMKLFGILKDDIIITDDNKFDWIMLL